MTTGTPFNTLSDRMRGQIRTDDATRDRYATDASPYKARPAAVAFPADADDCQAIIEFSNEHGIALISRAAGTSLAGQCTGSGLVVDISRHMRDIIDIDTRHRLARVQPGVIPATLNAALAADGLRFAPDPSTLDRCHIAGMAGNNAWGSHAPRDGTTRDHIAAMNVITGAGLRLHASALDSASLNRKLARHDTEGKLYRRIHQLTGENLERIVRHSPHTVTNNCGYALDAIARGQPWVLKGPSFSLVNLLCGSEGTLALTTGLTVRLSPVPGHCSMICPHFSDVGDALRAVPHIMKHRPDTCELIDSHIIELALAHPEHGVNRDWLKPGAAVLVVEFSADDGMQTTRRCNDLAAELMDTGLATSAPVLEDPVIHRARALRRAGLDMLIAMPGARKPVTGLEDGAVPVDALHDYVSGIAALLAQHDVDYVVYGSVSLGLVQLRPILDLNDAGDRNLFARLLDDAGELCLRHNGCFSAKHGDGRLRAKFMEQTLGHELMAALREIKNAFDPGNILNPGKLFGAPNVTEGLGWYRD